MRVAVLAVWVAGYLAMGCRSVPEQRYYTVDMTSSGKSAPDFGLEVDRIRSVEPLARRDILIKKTPTEVEYYAVDQWAADPGELVSEKLASEFGHRPDAPKQLRISGQVLAFGQVDTPAGPEAHLKIDLEFRRADADRFDEPALKKVYELRLPARGTGPSGIARALSDGLAQIAVEIAADAAQL